ncbi:outer membrane beta-barrel protein [Granulicella tundricola]|uniref:Uncharacterized protein n=1 Tax=Granulicella tundricola (strain ATCC BAA-1859 / DSM 23138 / MP5ACTX9) TaxID=1198114 RepID=E8X7E1_GRATM|nr:outer membrane beta-barrel protein [Granulicella tundricola]ADW71375.1 hypothetical protein AciX9_4427 [Granulicella tundricola MP5ACTX9]
MALSFAFCLGGLCLNRQAHAQDSSQTTEFKAKPGEGQAAATLSGRADSGPDLRPFLGGIYPEDLAPLLSVKLPVIVFAHAHRIRAYGWVDGGITTVSHASGLVIEAPTANRFSNQLMLNGAWLIIDRSTTQKLSLGFRTDFYVGSDAALLRPLDNFGPGSARWGTDFRQAYLLLHTPFLFKRGIDWAGGRINNPTGYETLMSPYRPLYSESYYWIHYEVGSTALQATLHPAARLDLVLGVVMGYNTAFELRGRAPDYIARAIYRPSGRKERQWLATVYSGPEPASAIKGHIGSWQTLSELQAREVWTPRISQVLQVHYMADTSDPANGRHTSSTQGAFAITSFKFSDKAYLNTRVEWFSDPHGVRVATPGTYSEATVGLNLHPRTYITFRPELRGDFAGQQSFGSTDAQARRHNQLSAAFELTFKAHLF